MAQSKSLVAIEQQEPVTIEYVPAVAVTLEQAKDNFQRLHQVVAELDAAGCRLWGYTWDSQADLVQGRRRKSYSSSTDWVTGPPAWTRLRIGERGFFSTVIGLMCQDPTRRSGNRGGQL